MKQTEREANEINKDADKAIDNRRGKEDPYKTSRMIGLILAGGEGRRMGYRNKGLVSLEGKPLVAHVIDRLRPQVDQLYLSANSDIAAYEAFGLPVIQDLSKWRGKGPLAGIASLLPHLKATDCLQVVSCDGPFIPTNLVVTLQKAREESSNGVKATYATTAERGHYLYLQGKVADLQCIEALLAADQLRIRALLEQLEAQPVRFQCETDFLNCNSIEDIHKLEEK
ncbi:molybdenum cofactor guanylyltransferase [Ignatzschineria ureiclastica]|uniref:Molybdenum cofactor guanylyltransferase n=1 Tax=Ignatzschineria ureiclastica TaxID=472582 RepID=A0A2U2AF78_9GAMM|nr:molybdenum cofactor guanylyltransferase MobA [Ignatzschineria ureiclastica]PWD81311.1 molybdenum cofactor guanylyltransferase [Ignatzschineria ureiclastica]GGZ97953.1 molybdenum cofactor guanylyltransferase [Ignatzschineria ureiclastica]